MPQFVCPTCGARLYSASQLTSDEKVDEPERREDDSDADDID